jgi:ribosomal-protein-alanine N-acetyltransferase
MDMDDLATTRMRLRQLSIDDAPAIAELFRDVDVARFHNLGPITDIHDAQEAISRVREGTEAGHMLRWAITVPPLDLAIGTAGFLNITPADRRAGIGYDLARPYWGQGLAIEAVEAVVRYGFQTLGLHRIEADVMPGNERSIRLLRTLGFVEEGRLRDYAYFKGRFNTLVRYGLLATDRHGHTVG